MPSYLITGVSRGIGRMVSERLLAAGTGSTGWSGPAGPSCGLGVAGVVAADLSRPESLEAALAPPGWPA